MNPKSIRIIALLIIALCCLDIQAQDATGSAQLVSGTNTLAGDVRHNLHLPGIRVHDPWILAYAPTRTYYL